jgi:hypothetical protein
MINTDIIELTNINYELSVINTIIENQYKSIILYNESASSDDEKVKQENVNVIIKLIDKLKRAIIRIKTIIVDNKFRMLFNIIRESIKNNGITNVEFEMICGGEGFDKKYLNKTILDTLDLLNNDIIKFSKKTDYQSISNKLKKSLADVKSALNSDDSYKSNNVTNKPSEINKEKCINNLDKLINIVKMFYALMEDMNASLDHAKEMLNQESDGSNNYKNNYEQFIHFLTNAMTLISTIIMAIFKDTKKMTGFISKDIYKENKQKFDNSKYLSLYSLKKHCQKYAKDNNADAVRLSSINFMEDGFKCKIEYFDAKAGRVLEKSDTIELHGKVKDKIFLQVLQHQYPIVIRY